MTENIQSPFLLVKQLQADILRLLSQLDIASLDHQQQRQVEQLRNNLIDARMEIQDYELAETREYQLRNAAKSKKYLQKVRAVVTGNTLHVFGAVDVAHLTAQLEQISDRLK